MSNVKLSFERGYKDFKFEIDGAEVKNATSISFSIGGPQEIAMLTVGVEIWEGLEIDIDGVAVQLGNIRLLLDDLHLVTALSTMLDDFKRRGLDPKLLEGGQHA